MDAGSGKGRPRKEDSRSRTGHFLTLIATGNDAETAARAAGLSPWRALRIVTESSFNEIVQAIRAGDLGPTAVVAAPGEHQAAA